MCHRAIYIVFLGILLTLAACGRRPRYVIPENKMMEVLYDIRLAEAIYGSENYFRTDSMKDALVNGVLQKHEITQAQLDSSLYWYADNISEYNAINDSVSSRLRKENDRYLKLQEDRSSRQRNFSGYIIPPFYYLTDITPTMAFNIDSFQIKNIDLPSFVFHFQTQGVNSSYSLDAGIFFEYRDTTIYEVRQIRQDSSYLFVKPSHVDSLLIGISGYVHMKKDIHLGEKQSSNVVLYNMQYTDSIKANNPGILPKVPPRENVPAVNEPKKIDKSDLPVVSRDHPMERTGARRNVK